MFSIKATENSPMAYLYRHIRLDKNEPFYIGIGKDDGVYKRARHKTKRNPIWKNITRKTPYEIEIVMEGLTWEEICQKECEFIALYGRMCDGGILANMTIGGDGLTGRTGVLNPAFGKPKSEHVKDKIRKSLSVRPILHSGIFTVDPKNAKLTQCRQILAFAVNGKFFIEFDSISQAQRETGIHKGNISNACKKRNGKYKTYKGFIWEYKSAFPDEKAVYAFVTRLFNAWTDCPTYASC